MLILLDEERELFLSFSPFISLVLNPNVKQMSRRGLRQFWGYTGLKKRVNFFAKL